MLNRLHALTRQLGLAFALVLGLFFAVPATAAHLCAEELIPAGVQLVSDSDGPSTTACPDCGPACANGCCHAQHPAAPPSATTQPVGMKFAQPIAGPVKSLSPPVAPKGPDRPPRF